LRPFISTSFTHLICGVKPAVCSMARTTAIAAEMVTNDRCDSGSVGCSRMVMYTPVSAGETNVRPSRPRPPVCSSANSVKPCLRPRYCSFIVVLDEVSDGSTRISRPMTAVSSSALMPAAVRLSSSEARR